MGNLTEEIQFFFRPQFFHMILLYKMRIGLGIKDIDRSTEGQSFEVSYNSRSVICYARVTNIH